MGGSFPGRLPGRVLQTKDEPMPSHSISVVGPELAQVGVSAASQLKAYCPRISAVPVFP